MTPDALRNTWCRVTPRPQGDSGAVPREQEIEMEEASPGIWTRTLLDLSIRHIPKVWRDGSLSDMDGVPAHSLDGIGILLWVPDDPLIWALEKGGRVPPQILQIQMFARRHSCDYVLFNPDSPVIDALPLW